MQQRKNIKIESKVNGQQHNICAIFPYNVRDNFISDEIVRRLTLRTHADATATRTITWYSERFSSVGSFVEMSFTVSKETERNVQRFHILKNCPFDMILGSATVGIMTAAVLM
jgi:hypothetical protein